MREILISQVDTTIARIPEMNAHTRATLCKNAENKHSRSPGDAAAQRIIEALDAFEGDRTQTADL